MLVSVLLIMFGCDEPDSEPPCLQTMEDETRALLDSGTCLSAFSSDYCLGSMAAFVCLQSPELCDTTIEEPSYRRALEYQLQCLEQR